MKQFAIIVAIDQNAGIGKNNDLPWKLKADMAWFREVTTNTSGEKQNAVVMGRKTWDSIPEKFRPLPGRVNIVISRSPEKVAAPQVVKSLDEALELASEICEKVFVIGGASVYEQAMKHRQLGELFITHINQTFDCDSFFPSLHGFKEAEVMREGSEEGLNFIIKRYVHA